MPAPPRLRRSANHASGIRQRHPAQRGPRRPAEWQTRTDLAAYYRLINHDGMDEMVANHIAVRVPGKEGTFLLKRLDGIDPSYRD